MTAWWKLGSTRLPLSAAVCWCDSLLVGSNKMIKSNPFFFSLSLFYKSDSDHVFIFMILQSAVCISLFKSKTTLASGLACKIPKTKWFAPTYDQQNLKQSSTQRLKLLLLILAGCEDSKPFCDVQRRNFRVFVSVSSLVYFNLHCVVDHFIEQWSTNKIRPWPQKRTVWNE